MGVDFLVCDHCGETFCDCGTYYICSCGRKFDECGDDFLEKYGEDPEGDYSLAGCDYCLGDLVDDGTLIEYLLDKVKMTREEIVKEINELCRV